VGRSFYRVGMIFISTCRELVVLSNAKFDTDWTFRVGATQIGQNRDGRQTPAGGLSGPNIRITSVRRCAVKCIGSRKSRLPGFHGKDGARLSTLMAFENSSTISP
jgi:hypothetical protein